MTNVSVVVPLGPNPAYLEWLPECIESVITQQFDGTIDIYLVIDGADVTEKVFESLVKQVAEQSEWNGYSDVSDPEYYFANFEHASCSYDRNIHTTKTLWNVGVADAFNFGVALSFSELVFMLGSDDKLYPTCLQECVAAWERNQQKDAWYSVTVEYSHGQKQAIPCNAAMVTKDLWKWLGGFPPSAGVGACDAILLSILMKHAPDRIIRVKEGKPLCWLRDHEHQDTKVQGWQFASEVISIRNKETLRWKPKTDIIK